MQTAVVAAEFVGVAIDPANRAPHLIDHRKQAAAGIVDIGEIEHDKMRASMHERLGKRGELRSLTVAPRATVNENSYGRVGLFAAR